MEDKKCPFCAEKINKEAIKCKHCWEFLEEYKTVKEKKKIIEQTKNDSFFKKNWKNILYTIAFLAMFAWISNILKWNNDFDRGMEGVLNFSMWFIIFLSCQSHTWLISRLNGKPRMIKEILPLGIIIVYTFWVLSFIHPDFLVANPLAFLPTAIYMIIYFRLNFLNKKDKI